MRDTETLGSAETGAPIEHFDVLIVGAGISGVGAAYHLTRQAPNKSFVALEAQESFGGTWLTHKYPGIRSDSDLYTFGYRFKPWVGPPIATAAEIRKYMGEVIDENDLGPDQADHPGRRQRAGDGFRRKVEDRRELRLRIGFPGQGRPKHLNARHSSRRLSQHRLIKVFKASKMVVDRSHVDLRAPADLLAGRSREAFLREHLAGNLEQPFPSVVIIVLWLSSFHFCLILYDGFERHYGVIS